MNEFIALFEKYHFDVTTCTHNSIIADNGKILVVCTVYNFSGDPEATAVALYSSDRKEIEKRYKDSRYGIGAAVYTDIMNNHNEFSLYGRIFNHDHSLGEIESALIDFTKS